ncbi:MAG TPA: tRNA (guanine-N7)-methyltransferase [Polyangiaceae bacterium]|nr:tRNA (guanine-N7)-methyltransferase [Polyangiaceae bacterium]
MKNHPYAPLAPRLPEGERVDPRDLVACDGRPIELEIGSGRGGFVFERLEVDPSIHIVALEVRLKWATLVDRKLRERGLGERARVFAEDARHAVTRFPDACLAAAFIHFPDPWWKKRHQKRLVMGNPLMDHLVRALCPQGQLFLQTDVEERARQYEELLQSYGELSPIGTTARVAENPFGARSPRERKAIEDGLPIHRLHYVHR